MRRRICFENKKTSGSVTKSETLTCTVSLEDVAVPHDTESEKTQHRTQLNKHAGPVTKSETLTITILYNPGAPSAHLQIPGLLICEVRRLGGGSSGSDGRVCAAPYLCGSEIERRSAGQLLADLIETLGHLSNTLATH